ncbi:MAG: alpha/beta hydrolase-fold protein [Flavobacteriales bacterium]
MRAFQIVCALAVLVCPSPLAGQCISPWCNPGGVIQESEGTTSLQSYYSGIHGKNIQYKIYLPKDYAVETDRHYPLILLLPGYGSTEVYTDYFVQLVARMSAGTFPRSILVVLNPIGNAFWHNNSQSTGTSTPVQGYSTVIDEMIPHLDANYRVGTQKANRALIGFSMGGYGALNLALRSNMFSSVTTFDAALRVVGNESPQLQFSCYNDVAQTTQHNLFTVLSQFNTSAQQTFLHLLVSTNGNADQALFHNQLTSIGAAHRFEDVSGTQHAWEDFFAVRADTTCALIIDHLVVPSNSITMSVKVFLQGPYGLSTGAMSSSLSAAGLLPTTEPYTSLGFAQVGSGGETASASILQATGANAITDWVFLELRNKNNPAQVLATRSALLRKDGAVVDVDGNSAVSFSLPPDAYYIAVRHRNHLGIRSEATWPLQAGSPLLDLTQSAANIHGTAQDAVVSIGGKWCMWSGDVTHDGEVKYTGTANDRDPVLIAIGGVLPTNTLSAYSTADINLDGVVKYVGTDNDRDPVLVNVGGSIPTATRVQQLP